MAFDTIVYNGAVLTGDARRRIIPHGWLGITAGRIRAVAAGEPAVPPHAAALAIDAAGGIVMPGLVNAHSHLPMSLFRGLADDLPLSAWLDDHIFPAELRFIGPETVRWGTLLAVAEMLLSGTTCCGDGYFYEDAVARAVSETGLRAVLGQGVVDFPAPGVPDPAQNVARARRYGQTWRQGGGRITPSIFCHAPYTCGDATLSAAKAAADEMGSIFQIHVAETRSERDRSLTEHGVSPVAHLDRLGVLDRRTLMAHCVWVDAADIDIIARRGCAVVHCPESNLKLASGIAPVADMLAAGITVALGTDGCASNNNLDLFTEMDTAAKLHKLATGDPTTLNAADVVSMATLAGARALGLDEHIGSLEIGKQADVLVIDTTAPHLTPMYHLESHLVYAAGGADVRHVLIDGRQVVRDRQVATIAVDTVIDRVNDIAEEIRSHLKTGCAT